MIQDKNLLLSNQQTITVTAYSTNTIPLGALRDIGSGEGMVVRVFVDQTFAGGTSLLINVLGHLTPDPAADVSGGVAQVLGATEAITISPFNFLVAGAHIDVAIGPAMQSKLNVFSGLFGNTPGFTYLSVGYTVSGTFTAGKVTAQVLPMTAGVRRLYPASTSS